MYGLVTTYVAAMKTRSLGVWPDRAGMGWDGPGRLSSAHLVAHCG